MDYSNSTRITLTRGKVTSVHTIGEWERGGKSAHRYDRSGATFKRLDGKAVNFEGVPWINLKAEAARQAQECGATFVMEPVPAGYQWADGPPFA